MKQRNRKIVKKKFEKNLKKVCNYQIRLYLCIIKSPKQQKDRCRLNW